MTVEEDKATMSVDEESPDESFTTGPELDMDSPFPSPISEPQFHPLTKDTEFSCGPVSCTKHVWYSEHGTYY